jgi:hypothetical protein
MSPRPRVAPQAREGAPREVVPSDAGGASLLKRRRGVARARRACFTIDSTRGACPGVQARASRPGRLVENRPEERWSSYAQSDPGHNHRHHDARQDRLPSCPSAEVTNSKKQRSRRKNESRQHPCWTVHRYQPSQPLKGIVGRFGGLRPYDSEAHTQRHDVSYGRQERTRHLPPPLHTPSRAETRFQVGPHRIRPMQVAVVGEEHVGPGSVIRAQVAGVVDFAPKNKVR